MNKNKIILTVSILLLLILGLVITLKSLKDNNVKTNSDIEIVQNEIVKEETKNYEIKDLGTIECKKIELNAPIKETTELDVLETAVGHFEDTAIYNGNV